MSRWKKEVHVNICRFTCVANSDTTRFLHIVTLEEVFDPIPLKSPGKASFSSDSRASAIRCLLPFKKNCCPFAKNLLPLIEIVGIAVAIFANIAISSNRLNIAGYKMNMQTDGGEFGVSRGWDNEGLRASKNLRLLFPSRFSALSGFDVVVICYGIVAVSGQHQTPFTSLPFTSIN